IAERVAKDAWTTSERSSANVVPGGGAGTRVAAGSSTFGVGDFRFGIVPGDESRTRDKPSFPARCGSVPVRAGRVGSERAEPRAHHAHPGDPPVGHRVIRLLLDHELPVR